MTHNCFGREGKIHAEKIDCSDCGKAIPAGRFVMWDPVGYWDGETDPYCLACTERQKRAHEAIDWDALAREMLGIPQSTNDAGAASNPQAAPAATVTRSQT